MKGPLEDAKVMLEAKDRQARNKLRLKVATAILSGIAANNCHSWSHAEYASEAVAMADALIAEVEA